MFFDYLNISTDINFVYLIIFFLILAAYSFFIYKHTLPKVSSPVKTFLIILRSLTIILILLLVFEPIVTIAYKKIIKPKIYVYVDNSKSIVVKDSLKRIKDNINAVKELITVNNSEFNIHTFGVKVVPLSPDSLNKINNNESLTNFNNVISHLSKSEDNIAAAVIISDGIITEGTNPVYDAEKLNIPIYTVGIGDTSSYKDISIKEVIHNKFIYANKQTEIEALITNTGLSNKTISVSLFEEDKLISTKNITLSESGLNRIKFDYTPSRIGNVKLHLQTSQLKEEENPYNNKKTFFINVLKDKIKVVLIAGSPSPDLSAISKALEEDKSIELKKIIQITKNKFWDNFNNKVDSANVIILIDFPSINTSSNYSEQIFSKIEKNKIPFLIVVSNNTDIHQLKNFERILPFNINNISNNFIQIEPNIISNSIKLIFQKSFEENEWSNLPPLTRTTTELTPKPASEILVKGTSRNLSTNIPLIISMNLGSIKSFAILSGDLWKWQLLTAEKNPLFFSNFINNIIKWLNISEKQNQFIVRTNKKIFSTGEPIEFIAELYDNTFSPIDSAKINLVVYNQTQKYNLVLDKIKDGLFQTQLNINQPGNFYYEATAEYDGITLKSNKDRFTITDTEIEKLNTRMDVNFLNQLANSTNGKFYFIDDLNLLKEDLSKILKTASKEKISNIEIDLHTDKWTLIIIIILLTVEWVIRKRSGMI
ncbi:vWA domain-containing protein [Rosettibacter firmus]|uniref:vWA domain-containing protein n=1 Tax=Rosettibacter firmus TaxID=3111522 RepID=UPI00336C2A50